MYTYIHIECLPFEQSIKNLHIYQVEYLNPALMISYKSYKVLQVNSFRIFLKIGGAKTVCGVCGDYSCNLSLFHIY